jgi:outer membrane protein OmpA-like peptidoglycan-associated protein
MYNFKLLALTTVAVVGLGAAQSYGAERSAHFTSHHAVDEKPYEQYAESLPGDEKLELREYLDYENREPCQFYQPIPDGFVKDGCNIVPEKPARMAEAVPVKRTYTVTERNVLADYEVHFAFDSAELEPEADNVIDKVAREIKQHNPGEVVVSGHTDRAGPSDYNTELSKERALAVSNALNHLGISNRIIDKKAFGENNLDIPTPDGVRLAENRRVEIEFLK